MNAFHFAITVFVISIGCANGIASEEDFKNKPMSFWEKKLSAEQVRVCRRAGTEPPFSGEYTDNHDSGTYSCSSCGQPLFDSKTKFNSGTGWPSFFDSLDKGRVVLHTDKTLGMERTEVNCSRCGAHLGHVFDDGPAPTGKRYCMNSVCLRFQKK